MRGKHLLLSAVGAVVAVVAFAKEPVRVIFDTDMYTDYDDVGAVAMLHAFADAGDVEILAMGTCSWGKGSRSVAAVEVLNAYYGRPDIPVGGGGPRRRRRRGCGGLRAGGEVPEVGEAL